MGFFDIFKKKKTTVQNEKQPMRSYPILLYENAAINARPPYKVLRFEDGDYMQIIDLTCSRFGGIATVACSGYSIALFRMKQNETEWISSNTDQLDRMAALFYERIPNDRFVKASFVQSDGSMSDLAIRPLCDSVDDLLKLSAVKKGLSLIGDTLTNEEKEKYVYTPVRNGIKYTKEFVSELSLRKIMSAVYVLANMNDSNLSTVSKETKNQNQGFLFSMAADWLKTKPFYVLCDVVSAQPIKLENNGIPFTCVFTEEELMNEAINEIGGNAGVCRVLISSDKSEFFLSLLQNGIVQIVVEKSPMPLSTNGCYLFSIAVTE